ncbi:related to metallophosphoesterase domain-containing protein 2 [Ramularia collo-cygni]|uniref:Related to metallophosphoesterase domain-containing protein 2 n=1 Tax=Ramularia collo-cygni TaxID=112498 RepID=A0A2D3V216_9PEZI|nr:related to metallophosphoesterase domain-containing protein 2 [Ramularia collo-cygni]CZT21848.1 related to metallophosphoesterase domain-containing protein 2 [Ramularia collo-cygni]
MLKFMILSDTHNFERDSAETFPLSGPLPKVDVVLHCGDLTFVGGLSSYKKALRMLGDFDAELRLVIAGNHDLSLDGTYWSSHLGEDDDPAEHEKAMETMTGPLAHAAGVTYLQEGLHSFTLKSGSSFKIFASPYQPEFCDWAFGYPRNEGEQRWNIPKGVDIVMTHGPPLNVLDLCKGGNMGCAALLNEVKSVAPLMHCFGHIHEGYGVEKKIWNVSNEAQGVVVKVNMAGCEKAAEEYKIERGSSTLMVNAAIMNEEYKPVNAPILIELPL